MVPVIWWFMCLCVFLCCGAHYIHSYYVIWVALPWNFSTHFLQNHQLDMAPKKLPASRDCDLLIPGGFGGHKNCIFKVCKCWRGDMQQTLFLFGLESCVCFGDLCYICWGQCNDMAPFILVAHPPLNCTICISNKNHQSDMMACWIFPFHVTLLDASNIF